MKTTLTQWAAKHFDPVPSLHTLRRMAREQRIVPAPVLVGREYYVEDSAQLTATPQSNGLVQRVRAAGRR